MLKRILTGIVAILAVVVIGAGAWLEAAPPELLRVGDGYAAKIVCSNLFLTGRDAESVLGDDVQAPGNPVLKLVTVKVEGDVVTARMAGLFAPGVAVHRPGLGCVSVPDGDVTKVLGISQPDITPAEQGAPVAPEGKLAAVLGDAALTGPGMRAVVVMKDGQVIGESYGKAFTPNTRLLGWSMTKTVNAALLGRVVADGKLGLDDAALFPVWQDGRKAISVRDLAAMKSGLTFDEDYGDVSDVSRMLYLQPDMAGFAAHQRLHDTPGEKFHYSTGTSLILARLWMDRIGDRQAALAFPRQALFAPLGMTSAVYETDEHGTYVGGSYLYATARDWGRFGQFLMQDGVWEGKRLLPRGFVALMHTPNGDKEGYGQMQAWVKGPGESDTGKSAGLPADAFWLRGHDGQTVTIIPSEHLVIVRMGLTPWDLGYRPEALVKAVVIATH